MPTVKINDVTFVDISLLRAWFRTETPDETIAHIVKMVMEKIGIEQDKEQKCAPIPSWDELIVFNVAPNLSYTKVIRAVISGTPIQNQSWAGILHAVIAKVKDKGLEGEALAQELRIQSHAGTSKTLRFVPELGISVQSLAAPAAWKEVDRLASKWGIPVTVEFVWKQKISAKRLGKGGILQSGYPKKRGPEGEAQSGHFSSKRSARR